MLAGGQARRLDGADKPGIKIGGLSLVSAVVTAAIRSGVTHVVVVGPDRPDLADEVGEAVRAHVEFTREEPPGGGPVPALRAGLGLVTERWVLLLAADLPFLSGAVLRHLRSAAASGAGAVLVDDAGRPQWLLSCWRTAELRAALQSYPGTSLRGLFAPIPHADLAVLAPPGEPPYWLDCDTPEDLVTAGQWARHHVGGVAMTVLTDWIAAVCAEIGIDPSVVDERVILDLARDAAHQVDRPAAPVTTFLLGIAVGGGQSLTSTADRLSALAATWPNTHS